MHRVEYVAQAEEVEGGRVLDSELKALGQFAPKFAIPYEGRP